MKKFLFSLLVALISAAMWQTAEARYYLGSRVAADDIKAGDTIALQAGTFGGSTDYYMGLTLEGALQEVTPWSSRSAWIVSEGPVNYKGEKTYYLQNMATGQYLGNSNADPLTNGVSSFGQMKDDIEYAVPLVKSSSADSSDYAETYGPTWDENSVTWSFAQDGKKNLFVCNCSYWSKTAVYFWEYHDTNAWNAFYVHYEHDMQGDLQALIDEISEAGIEYEGGTNPGEYPQEKVDAFNQALEEALLCVLEEHTDAEYKAAMDKLLAAKEAVENSVNPITDGYYYIISAYPEFVNKNGLEKAMTANSNTQLGWTTLNNADPKQVFHITTLSNGHFNIQNYWNDRYINGAESNAASTKVLFTTTPSNEQTIKPIGALQWVIANTFNSRAYHPESHSNGSGQSGDIVQWDDSGNPVNSMSVWYIRMVPDDVLATLPEIKTQYERTEQLRAAAQEASAIWDAITVYTVSTEGLITNANDDDPDNQVSSNAKDPNQGTYAALIDSTTSIFHSTWHPSVNEPYTVPHNLQFNFSKTPTSGFQVRMLQRCDSWGTQDRPCVMNFYASNAEDLTADDAWTFIRQVDITSLWGNNTDDYQNWVTTPTVDLGQEYKYVRMDVIATGKNRKNSGATYPFFSLAELQVYPVVMDKTNSQYCYTEGLAEKADLMYALMKEATGKVEENSATEEDIANLKAAIADVKTLFADTTEIAALVTTLEAYANTAVLGEGIGQTTAEAVAALKTALSEAKTSGFSTPLVKSEVDAATEKLVAAKTAFLATIKMPEPDKWYHLISASNVETHYNGGNTDDPMPMANSAVYADGPDNDRHIRYGKLAEDGSSNYEYDPYTMFRLVETAEEGKYAIQCLGTGMYLGNAKKLGESIYSSNVPVPYEVKLLGNASFGLYPAGVSDNDYAMVACLTGKHMEAGEAVVYGDGAWSFQEINPDDVEMIVLDIFSNNMIDVIALPFDVSGLADFNEDVHIYGIKKMTKNTDNTTTVELYEKDELAAGESAILVIGDPTQEGEDTELVIPFPTTVVDKAVPANGIVGILQAQTFEPGVAYSNGEGFVCSNNPVSIVRNTGVIDPATYKGEVADAETALTIVIDGLAWPDLSAGDVDGDGKVNTSDVVAVYSYIIDGTDSGIDKAAADVDGDGNVTTADVVAIYDIIINGTPTGSGSNGFYPTDEGQAEMSAFVGSSDDLTKVPVTITLAIPEGKEITAFEASLEIFAAPEGVVADESVEGSVQKFLFNGRRAVVEDTDRWTEDHSGTYSKGTKEHGANSMFISIVNQYLDPFTGSEGPIITVFFDASDLAEGDYVVRAFDLLAVGTDKSSQTSPDVDAKFTVKDGKVTAVTAITAEEFAAAKAVYTLDGKKVAAPQKGQIYVVDGKTVKF